jgi:hypothetical protein
MRVYQVRIPMNMVRNFGSLAVGAVGTVAGVHTGDATTFTVHEGVATRWEYAKIPEAIALALGLAPNSSAGQAQQLTDGVPGDYTAQQVCGSIDVQEPTPVPGLLSSVAVSIGCTGGTWACHGGVCSSTGEAAKPKLVLDVMTLLK